MMGKKLTLCLGLFGFLASHASLASTVDLSDSPLAIHEQGAPPNVMLLVDDSRSMSCTNEKNGSVCGDDMFYAPGYDPDKVYACDSNIGVLNANPNYVMTVHVSKVPKVLESDFKWWEIKPPGHFRRDASYVGTPYFRYTTKGQMANLVNSVGYYAWGKHPGTDTQFNAPEIPALDGLINPRHKTSPRRCFNVNQKYRSYLRTSLQAGIAPYGSFDYASIIDPVGTPEKLLSGNFLNWYFSRTVAEWNIKNTQGNYVMKNYSGQDGHWDSRVANNFITGAKQYAWGRDWVVNGWQIRADNYVYPEKTEINGSHLNEVNKTWFPAFPPVENDLHVNVNFLGAGHAISELEITGAFHQHGTANINDMDTLWSMKGMKPGVYYAQFRLNVAKDVAKTFVNKLENANIAVSSFFSLVENKGGSFITTAAAGNAPDFNFKDLILNTTSGAKSPGELLGAGGTLVHGFVPVNLDEPVISKANRVSLYNSIDMISGNHGTPTAETMVGVARYFFQGWEKEEIDFVTERHADGSVKKTVEKKLGEVLVLPLKNTASKAHPPVAYNKNKIITKDKFCRKNYLVVMTDGRPFYDWGYDGYYDKGSSGLLSGYDTVGTTNEPVAQFGSFSRRHDSSGLVRVAGALYDHDWLPSVDGIQNIETLFVRLGEATIGNEFRQAGRAGSGGKSANFYHGNDGEALLDAFNKIADKINNETFPQSVTAIALSSVTKLESSNYAFQASYNSHYWDSDLKALLVDADGNFIKSGAGQSSSNGVEPLWEAGAVLSQMYLLNDNDINGDDKTAGNKPGGYAARDVYSYTGSQGVKIDASDINSLPASIKADLQSTSVGDASKVLAYLMGDIRYEQGVPGVATPLFRQRATYVDADQDGLIDAVTEGGLLADAIHSSPVYVAEPPRSWDDKNFAVADDRYSKFKKAQANRKPVVYMGTNGGFLHAFGVKQGSDAQSQPAGGELFAYMPSMLASTESDQGYHYLANPDYEHRYYVDLTATPSDVYMDFYTSSGLTMQPEWRTVLVGGLGKGGKGLFALDITCPYQTSNGGNTCDDEKFSKDNVLWEFSADDDADFGYSFGEPIIAKVNVDVPAGVDDRNGDGTGRWAAIVSNGYNPSSKKAVLFILFLDGGLDGQWTLGEDYLKIEANSSSAGLSSATGVDITQNGMIDYVYAGDLAGNMWVFDIKDKGTWTKANNVRKLFSTGGKPITTPPQVSRNNEHKDNNPNVMVMFGTGQYLNTNDLSNKQLQMLYGVHDSGASNLNINHLAQRSFDAIDVSGVLNRKIIENSKYTDSKHGWYLPLQTDVNETAGQTQYRNDGERVIYRSFLVNNVWVLNTMVPNFEACGSNTSGWTLLIDWTTGLAPEFATYNADNSIPVNGNRGIDAADEGYVGFYNAVSASQLARGGANTFFGINDIAHKKNVEFGSAHLNKRIGWEEHFPYSQLKP